MLVCQCNSQLEIDLRLQPGEEPAIELIGAVGLYRCVLMNHIDIAEVSLDVGVKHSL